MLDIIRQKASHLWIAFYKSVYSVWACIGIYAVLLWIIWQGLQQASCIVLYMSILWMIFISWLVSGTMAGSFVYYDEDLGHITRNYYAVDIKGFSVYVLSFAGALMISGDIRILIFPIATSIPIGSSVILDQLDWYNNGFEETYVGGLLYESSRIKRIWTRERQNQYRNRHDFMCNFVSGLVGVYFGIFLVACFCTSSDERFKKCVTSGAITIAISCMTFVWILFKKEKATLPMRKAMGGKISHNAISELKRMYPAGLDTDRIQFLLHDTLKQRGSAGLGWHNNVNRIRSILRLFPGIASTMHFADDEGDISFRLACQYSSVEVVEHMVGLDNELLNIRDNKGNTVMHYSCQGNNYKVVNYLLNRHMILAITRNFDGNLPVYILCSNEQVVDKCCRRLFVEDAPRLQHLETVMRLMLAYPEDMQREKIRAASPPQKVLERSMDSEEEQVSTPALMGQAVDSKDGDDHQSALSPKPQKNLKLLIYIILVLVNMAAVVYIGTLQTLSNTNQMKHESEVKKLVDELIASQNEMNLLRSRMKVLKHASEGHSHSMLKVI